MQAAHVNAFPYDSDWSDHLNRVESYVKRMRQGNACSPAVPLWHLRALHDKSLHAGLTQISELCSKIEARIVAMYVSRDDAPADLMSELSRVANIIEDGATTGVKLTM